MADLENATLAFWQHFHLMKIKLIFKIISNEIWVSEYRSFMGRNCIEIEMNVYIGKHHLLAKWIYSRYMTDIKIALSVINALGNMSLFISRRWVTNNGEGVTQYYPTLMRDHKSVHSSDEVFIKSVLGVYSRGISLKRFTTRHHFPIILSFYHIQHWCTRKLKYIKV